MPLLEPLLHLTRLIAELMEMSTRNADGIRDAKMPLEKGWGFANQRDWEDNCKHMERHSATIVHWNPQL